MCWWWTSTRRRASPSPSASIRTSSTRRCTTCWCAGPGWPTSCRRCPGSRASYLVPATIDLAGAEVHLLSRTGREHVLARALVPVLDDYDAVLIDCPPSLGVLTINGLTAAEAVLVPLQCEALSHRGVGPTARDDRGRAPVRQREAARARRDPHHVRQPHDARPPGARRGRGALRPPALRAAGAEVGAVRRGPGPRAVRAAACADLRRRRGVPDALDAASTTPCRRPDMAPSRSDKAPDPLGKRALFWVPAAEPGRSAGRSRDDGGAAGRQARALLGGAPGVRQPGRHLGQPARRTGRLHGRVRSGAARPRTSACSTC